MSWGISSSFKKSWTLNAPLTPVLSKLLLFQYPLLMSVSCLVSWITSYTSAEYERYYTAVMIRNCWKIEAEKKKEKESLTPLAHGFYGSIPTSLCQKLNKRNQKMAMPQSDYLLFREVIMSFILLNCAKRQLSLTSALQNSCACTILVLPLCSLLLCPIPTWGHCVTRWFCDFRNETNISREDRLRCWNICINPNSML